MCQQLTLGLKLSEGMVENAPGKHYRKGIGIIDIVRM